MAQLAGILVLLVPAPERLKEWAYTGFAITLGSALIAHLAVGDDVAKWSWAAGTAVLWALSYFFFRKLAPAEGPPCWRQQHEKERHDKKRAPRQRANRPLG